MCFLISLNLLAFYIDKAERELLGIKDDVWIENIKVEKMLENEVLEIVEEMAIRYQCLAVEAKLDRETGELIAEQDGFYVDVNKTVHKLMTAEAGDRVKLAKKIIKSSHKGEDLYKANTILSEYQTAFTGSSERRQNISTALRSINYWVLWPEEEFSFNEITGPRTSERGYMPAPIIISGAVDLGYGGGVCQVSSTLYNAVMLAELPVLERHGHSKAVHYVPKNRDATVDYGYMDLRFLNDRKGPLIIKAGLVNGWVRVEIWGERN